jgi:hypothetical protein
MKTLSILTALAAFLLAGCAATSNAGGAGADEKPFGGAGSVDYAAALWKQLSKQRLVGPAATLGKHYQGVHPHGTVLDTIEGTVEVGGHQGTVIVKRNYGGEGVSIANAANDPGKYLQAVTVMFKREAGYDAENKDWFWAKYTPAGAVMDNPKGVALAGRVAKGKQQGCIACHKAAPGGDLVYLHDRY